MTLKNNLALAQAANADHVEQTNKDLGHVPSKPLLERWCGWEANLCESLHSGTDCLEGGHSILDRSRRIAEANEPLEPWSNHSPATMLGKSLPILLPDRCVGCRGSVSVIRDGSQTFSGIKLRSRLPAACLSVQDRDSGLKRPYLANVFHLFFTTDAVKKGSGVGLYKTRLFAERRQGTVSVETQEDAGSTFYLRVPQTDSRG